MSTNLCPGGIAECGERLPFDDLYRLHLGLFESERKRTGGVNRAAEPRRVNTLPGHLSTYCDVELVAFDLVSYSIAGTPVVVDHTPGRGTVHLSARPYSERVSGPKIVAQGVNRNNCLEAGIRGNSPSPHANRCE